MSQLIEYLPVFKGTTANFSFALKSGKDITTGWTCAIQLRTADVDAVLVAGVDRPITDTSVDGLQFVVKLTPSELDIDPKKYVLAAELIETATGDKFEGVIGIEICRDWVY